MESAPDGIRAHIHPGLAPYGNIEDGTHEEIAAAEAWLKSRGCTHARGPLGPSTWHSYRAIIESNGRPSFLGEPSFTPDVWEDRGYKPCAHYASALADNLEQAESAAERSCTLVSSGWDIRPLDSHRDFQSALACFYEISRSAFTAAFAYTPLPYPEFQALYTPIESLLDPRMVLTAYDPSGQAAGFCFSIPDRLNPEQKAFIIKTLAVLPKYRQAGIGSWLVGVSHSVAHELGWVAGGIHALMWTGSHSRSISKHAGTLFRRYALYEKVL